MSRKGNGAAVDEIWVAAGTYSPGTSRVAAFRLKSGLGVYGGFDGGETARDERDPLTYPTILSGDAERDDGPDFANTGDNNYHVVISTETDPTAVLDGFTITGGHANGLEYPFDRGGGAYIHMGSPTLANCVFTGNVASARGGGLYSAWSWNWPYTPSAATLINCIFSGNVAADGGGLYNRTSATTVMNCVFSGNSATNKGGAMYNWPGSHSTVTNCTFSGNSAASDGGAMYAWGNTRPVVTNCIFWINVPQAVFDFGNTTITYSNVEGGGPGVGNIDGDPLFVDIDGADDVLGTEDDNVRLSLGSPCVDSGDNDALPSSITTDVNGNDRYVDGDLDGLAVIDMGAYELPSVLDCNENGSSDEDDIASGTSSDCNRNGIPDECEEDCNENRIADECDISEGISTDYDGNGIPDECQPDTDGDGVPDFADQCPGVDDSMFAPECVGAIPTVSAWGLIVITLLLLVTAKVFLRTPGGIPGGCHAQAQRRHVAGT